MDTAHNSKLFQVPRENLFQLKEFSKFITFKPKVYIHIESKDYVLKTATNFKELREAFKLRFKCFVEKNSTNPFRIKLDIDEFDFKCDHLLIICKKTKKVCGTYRLRSSKFVSDFYSEDEFFLKKFLKQEGNKVELGRACVHEKFRNGTTINLLWKGISEYMKVTESDYLFGCSSVYSVDPEEISILLQYLKNKNYYSNIYNIDTQIDFHMDIKEDFELTPEMEDIAKRIFPGLVKTYLMAGSKIHGYPAHDKNFQCVDLLTIMHVSDLSSAYKRRYYPWLL